MDLEFKKGEPQKMGKGSALIDMPDFPEIFTTGGDERLPLDPVKGHNKYFIKPYYDEEAIVRSSCTCSSPTELGYKAAEYYYEKLNRDLHEEMKNEFTNEIRKKYLDKRNKGRPGLNQHDQFDESEEENSISGPDTEYEPNFMNFNNFLLYPEKSLKNVIHLAKSSNMAHIYYQYTENFNKTIVFSNPEVKEIEVES